MRGWKRLQLEFEVEEGVKHFRRCRDKESGQILLLSHNSRVTQVWHIVLVSMLKD